MASAAVVGPTSHADCVGCRTVVSTEPQWLGPRYYGETRECTHNDYEDIAQIMVMEHHGGIMQTFQVGSTKLEPWDYDPRSSAEMSVDISGYVGIIAPQKIIQAPCKLLGTRAHTFYEPIFLMR